MLTPVESEIEALSWIWVALPSVARQIPPPPVLSEEELKENPPKPAPTVLDPVAMFAETMKRAAAASGFLADTADVRDLLLPAIHRAAFPNADAADHQAAVALLVQQEQDLAAHNKHLPLRTLAEILYRRVLHPHWLPPVDHLAIPIEGGADAAAAGAEGGGGKMGARLATADTASNVGGSRASRTMSMVTPRGLSIVSSTPPPATALVKLFRDLAQAVLDAPTLTTEPRLLPLERVMSLPNAALIKEAHAAAENTATATSSSGAGALKATKSAANFDAATVIGLSSGTGYTLSTIPVELPTFVELDAQPEHPAVFDAMWEAMVSYQMQVSRNGGVTAEHRPDNSCVSVETFQQWLGLFLSFTVDNFMEERSRVAGAHHFAEIYGVNLSFGSKEFRDAARRLFVLYTRRLVPRGYAEACVPHFDKMMRLAAEKLGAGSSGNKSGGVLTVRLTPQESDLPADVIARCKFTTADALFAPDNLDAQETLDTEVFPAETVNRVLVTGKEGLVAPELLRKLAAALNVRHIDVLELLVAAYDNKSGAHAQQAAELRACIEEERPIPLALQAQLVAEVLADEGTKFRGYVFGELPPALAGDAAWVETFLAHSTLADHGHTPPRVVLEMSCVDELYGRLRAQFRDAVAAVYSAELAIRDKEADEIAAREAKAQRKDAARKRIAEREERRAAAASAARGADSPQPPEEDAEAEARREAEDAAILEEEDEVDPDTIDPETGAPLDPELVPAAKAAKAAQRKRRSDLAELHRLYHASRTVDSSAPLAPSTVAAVPELAAIAASAAANGGRHLRHLPCHDDTPDDLVRHVVRRLQLQPTVTPKAQTMPAEAQQGYESTPDADAAVGETFREELLGAFRRSVFGDYCPVTKLEDGVLVAGSWFYSCSYREYAYCFASAAKLRKFVDSPTRYLLQDPSSASPVLLCQDAFGVMERAGFSPAEVAATLAAKLRLSARGLGQFHSSWRRFDAEVARRAAIVDARRAADVAEKKEREARLKAAVLEAEAANKGKKGGAAGAKTATASKTATATAASGLAAAGAKGGKKPTAAAAAAAAKAEADAAKKAAEAVPGISPADIAELEQRRARAQAELVERPPTTESRIAARIKAEQLRRVHAMRPLLVSALEAWDADELRAARGRKALPELVVSFHYTEPPKLDADGNPVAGDAAALDDADDDAAAGHDDAAAAAASKNVNPDDPKQARRFWAKFLAELDEEAQAAQTLLAESGGENGVAANPDAPQNFKVIRINLFDYANGGGGLSALMDMVLYSARELGFRCDPNAGGGELVLEDEEPELDEHEEQLVAAGHPPPDPLLRAGPKAVHQFGDTAAFCPVALVRDGMLVQGDPAVWLQLNGKKFIFATQANLDAFKQLPSRYIPVAPPEPAPLPPPRVWMLGPAACGKDELATELCREFGLVRFSTKPDRLLAYLAAATAPASSDNNSGSSAGNADGVEVVLDGSGAKARIPRCDPAGNAFLREAVRIKKELDDFAKEQGDKAAARAQAEKDQAEREQWIDDGEEVEELSEAQQAALQAALEWEAEDEELKAERLALAHRRLAACLSRIEPWASRGYLLVGEPASDAELTGLLDAKLVPEVVVRLTLGVDSFLERRFQAELSKREAEYATRARDFRLRQSALQLFARVAEITKWRRRNIGADDASIDPPPELENGADEEPEPVDVEAVRGDLERLFEASSAEVDALVEMLPERRIPVVTLRGDDGREALLAAAKALLARNLLHRPSLLEHPQVLTVDDAMARLKAGRALLSSFAFEDPVLLFERRHEGKLPALKWADNGTVGRTMPAEEPAWTEPTAEPVDAQQDHAAAADRTPKPREKKYKIVEDDDGNEIEVTDEDYDYDADDAAAAAAAGDDDDAAAAAADEDGDEPAEPEEDPFLQLEENPDLSPEELDELKAELQAERKRRADRLGRRACILRNRIYFFDGDATLRRFLTENPRRFCEQSPPLPRTSGSIVAVQAPQDVLVDDAKHNTVESVAGNCGAVFISLPKLVEWGCCSKQAEMFPSLRRQALAIALHRDPATLEALASRAGTPTAAAVDAAGGVDSNEDDASAALFTDRWVEMALACRLQCSDVQERGAVLCNLPRTPAQLKRLLAEGIEIHNVLAFDRAPAQLVAVARELGKTIRCVHAMQASLGTSQALHEAAGVINATADARRRVILARQLGFPLIVDAAALKEEQVLSSKSRSPHYGYYSPWTWAREDRLLERDPHLDVTSDPSCAARRNVVEFLGQLFFFSDGPERVAEFLAFPERFIGARFQPKKLPRLLPRRVHDAAAEAAPPRSGDAATAAATEAGIELCGFCPVALCDSRTRRGLCGLVEPRAVPGDARFTAEYDKKKYRMHSEEALQRFLSEPWTYVAGAVLPGADRFPQSRDDLESASLELFLRRALREAVARAMSEVERVRPKFPNLSVQQSALRFIALYMRAHHPEPQSDFSKRVHAENYDQFVELATMAREGGLVPPKDPSPEEQAAFEQRCKMWDALLDDPQAFYERFSGLRMEPEDRARLVEN